MFQLKTDDMSPEEALFTQALKVAWDDAFIGNRTEKALSMELFTAEAGDMKKHLDFLCLMAGVDPDYIRDKFDYYIVRPQEYLKQIGTRYRNQDKVAAQAIQMCLF